MANCPHTSFKQGKKIIIIFKDGTKRIATYLGNKAGVILTKELGRVKVNKIRSTGVFKKVIK
jgi:hypothetical protein